MSSDVYDGEDEAGNSLSMSMNVHNVLSITAMAAKESDPSGRGIGVHEMVTLVIKPNEYGRSVAHEICCALNEWLRHISEE